jgi:hypothetical protein
MMRAAMCVFPEPANKAQQQPNTTARDGVMYVIPRRAVAQQHTQHSSGTEQQRI